MRSYFIRGIELVFLKEPHINTEVYHKAIRNQIQLTGTKADIILEAVNQYLMELAKEQIRISFEQAEKRCRIYDREPERVLKLQKSMESR